MKKLVAIVCIIVMMSTVAVSALAAGSIVEPQVIVVPETTQDTTKTEVKIKKTKTVVAEQIEYMVVDADPARYDIEALGNMVKAVNSEDTTVTVKDVVLGLADLNDNITDEGVATIESKDGTAKTVDLAGYDFAGKFFDIMMKKGGVLMPFNGAAVTNADVKVVFDVLKGAEAADLENYLILLVNPITGQVEFIELDADTFDSANGSLKVKFPFMGTFTLIQKIVE